MAAVIFGGISAGVALLGLLITLLVMFGKIVDQNATMRTSMKFVSDSLEEFKTTMASKWEKIEVKVDAIRDSQRR